MTDPEAHDNNVRDRTEVLYGTDNVINNELRFFSETKIRIDTCMDYSRPALAIGIEAIRKSFVEAKRKGVQLRYLTEITNDNLSYCKELMSIVNEVRHLDSIKGNFMIVETIIGLLPWSWRLTSAVLLFFVDLIALLKRFSITS